MYLYNSHILVLAFVKRAEIKEVRSIRMSLLLLLLKKLLLLLLLLLLPECV